MTNPKRESRVPRFRRAVRRKTRAVRRRAVRAIRGRQRAAAIAAAAILLVTVSIAAAARGLGLRGALLQTRREVSARLAETPFARLDTFLTAMTDGGIGADFSVTDARGDTYAGRVAYASDSKRGKALTAELTLAGAPLDFALYVNRERAALRDSRVGQDTIGFRYDTFERDIAVLARKTGLADETVSRLTDAARRLETAQSGDAATLRPDNLTEPLDKLLDKFWKSLHFERSRADDAARYTAAIPAARLAELAEDIYAAYYDGGTLGALYELLALPAYSPFYNALAMDALGRGGADEAAYFARLAAMLGDLKENLTGELTLTFDVIDGRVAAMAAVSGLRYGGDAIVCGVTANFGARPEDDWTLTATYVDAYGDDCAVTLTWSYSEIGGARVNTANYHYLDGFTDRSMRFASDWRSATGEFALAFRSDYDGTDAILRGVLTADKKQTTVELGGGALHLTLTASRSAEVASPEFIGMDAWDAATADALRRVFGG